MQITQEDIDDASLQGDNLIVDLEEVPTVQARKPHYRITGLKPVDEEPTAGS